MCKKETYSPVVWWSDVGGGSGGATAAPSHLASCAFTAVTFLRLGTIGCAAQFGTTINLLNSCFNLITDTELLTLSTYRYSDTVALISRRALSKLNKVQCPLKIQVCARSYIEE